MTENNGKQSAVLNPAGGDEEGAQATTTRYAKQLRDRLAELAVG
jgi:hypothetical protein